MQGYARLGAAMVATLITFSVSPAFADEPDLEARLRARLETVLKDAPSARLEVLGAPKEASYTLMGIPEAGQVICTRVNAKNGYGGYAGWEPLVFTVHSDGSIGVLLRGDRETDAMIDKLCGAELRS